MRYIQTLTKFDQNSIKIKTNIMNTLTILLGIIGGPEIIIIALIILVLFGGRKIPELMGGLGKGMKEFKKATSDAESTVVKEKEDLKNVINGEVT